MNNLYDFLNDFDLVFCGNINHYGINDQQTFLSNLASRIRSGGILVIAQPEKSVKV